MLEQKWWRSLLTRETAELVTEITQELQSWQAEGTKILNGNRPTDKIGCQPQEAKIPGIIIIIIVAAPQILACLLSVLTRPVKSECW